MLTTFYMTHLIVQQIEKKHIRSDVPEIRAGYTVRVHQKIKEGEKERIQLYEGLVIAINHGQGASRTMTVRKMVEGIGVEKIFPINSPNLAKIEVIKIGKVRRSKLYYMRNVSGKAARLKETMVSTGNHKIAISSKVTAEEVLEPKTDQPVTETPAETIPETVLETIDKTTEIPEQEAQS